MGHDPAKTERTSFRLPPETYQRWKGFAALHDDQAVALATLLDEFERDPFVDISPESRVWQDWQNWRSHYETDEQAVQAAIYAARQNDDFSPATDF